MGFYAPSQIVQDVARHGVEVRPVDVRYSHYDCTLERTVDGEPALRLGLRLVGGLSVAGAERLVAARSDGPWRHVTEMARRCALDRGDLGALADAGALRGLAGHRHRARWEVAGVEEPSALFGDSVPAEGIPLLRRPTEGQDIAADYRSMHLSLERHPMSLLRPRLQREHIHAAADLWQLGHGSRARFAGLVINRQRPGSARGVTFVTLEDETGHANIIVWKQVAERQRRALLGSRLMEVTGRVQREGDVLHLVAERLRDRSSLLGDLLLRSRDFH
jgi:error-prone DNA polymerase